jgi:hypothetical protein
VLLADTDRRGVRSAGLVAAKMADYARVHRAMEKPEGPFRTEVAFSSWPEKLPEDASTLAEYTAGSEADALLCQALFDKNAANLDLHEGFHGRRMLGLVTYAGLLHEADQDAEDALACMVDDMAQAAREGEEVQMRKALINIFEMEILELAMPLLRIRVRCSKGTYIRSLAIEIGEALSSGAHLAALRRTRSGDNLVEDAWPLEELIAAMTPPAE